MGLGTEFWKFSTRFLNPGMFADDANVMLKARILFQDSKHLRHRACQNFLAFNTTRIRIMGQTAIIQKILWCYLNTFLWCYLDTLNKYSYNTGVHECDSKILSKSRW